MTRKPRRRTSEPPTTILALAPRGVDYTGADLAAVAVELGITSRPVAEVRIDKTFHPLYRRMFSWGVVETPLYDETVAESGDPLLGRAGAGDVLSGVVVEVRDAVAVGA